MKVALTDIPSVFGIRSFSQVKNGVSHMLKQAGSGFQLGTSTLGFFRPGCCSAHIFREIPSKSIGTNLSLF